MTHRGAGPRDGTKKGAMRFDSVATKMSPVMRGCREYVEVCAP
jgi:hypothetical protein